MPTLGEKWLTEGDDYGERRSVETRPSSCRRSGRHTCSDSPSPEYPIQGSNVRQPPALADCRWVDQFTKLQLWKLTEYERIVYMDSDLFPIVNTEELFQLDLDQQSTTDPAFNYSFAAAPNLIDKDETRLIIGSGFNAGFFILKPDQAMFDRIWARAMDPAQPWNMYRDMEQGLLNDIFATSGRSPMYRLEWTWNVKDKLDEYLEQSKIVHSRYFPLIHC
jgi:alpha-N-acetylglucosamine transferase